MSKFNDSVAKFKRERFREYSVQNREWPDGETEAQFDQAIKGLKDKRDAAYGATIMKKYPKAFLEKVFAWATVELSPLEWEKTKTFEDLSSAFIQASPDSVTTKEIGLFFDKFGKPRQVVDHEDQPLGEVQIDEYGNLSEKPPAPKIKVSPSLPTFEEAKKMSSGELAKILPKGD